MIIADMCSGTLLLEETDIMKGRKVTDYHGYEERLLSGQFIHDENLITSVRATTPYPITFKITVFGLLKVQEAAFNMQLDLLMPGKHIYTTLRYPDQIAHPYQLMLIEGLIMQAFAKKYY